MNVTDIIEKAELLAEGEEVAINAENFPDDSFRAFIEKNHIDRDGNKKLNQEEREGVTIIGDSFFDPLRVSSFKGIEYFTELKELYCEAVTIMQELDVSNNKKLTHLFAVGKDNDYSGNFKEINVTQNEELIELNVSYNKLTSLNISNNKNLVSLNISNNQLKKLDLSANTELVT